ncbi:MAG TPA: flagellar hook-basal body complex protein FliE [Candidatus Kapabacteria bacterium]|nr:flagellar hook-basal body complex protein FliE [Candidatus Kapabacteria bacterium]
MIINEIKRDNDFLPLAQQKAHSQAPDISKGVKFTDTINELISDTNNLQIESSQMTEAMIKGEPVDIHDVMISAQKAKTSFQLLMELRNKGLDLYREVLRMQI